MTCAPSRTDVRADALARFRVTAHGVTRARPPRTRAQALEVHDYYPFGMRHATQAEAQGEDYRKEFIGKERVGQQIGLDLNDFGARYLDPALGRWITVDKMADDLMQVDKSPYAYAWNDPANVTDPDGNCPWCIGAAVGAGLDIVSQVGVSLYQGEDLGDAVGNIDWKSVGVSAVAGAAGVGIAQKVASASKFARLGSKATKVARVTSEVATDATVSVVTQAAQDREIDVRRVASDAVVGQVARGTVGQARKAAAARTKTGKQLQENVNRQRNIAERGSGRHALKKSDADIPGAEAAHAKYLAGERAVGAGAAAGATRRAINAVTSDEDDES